MYSLENMAGRFVGSVLMAIIVVVMAQPILVTGISVMNTVGFDPLISAFCVIVFPLATVAVLIYKVIGGFISG